MAGEPPPRGQRDSRLVPANAAGAGVRPALGNAQPPSGQLPPGSHRSVHAGDWLAGPVGQSPTLAEQEVRGAEDAQGWVGEGFRRFTWWQNCIVCLKPRFIIFIIHVLFLGTQPASQMSKCFCELSPSELVSAWPPGSYSSQGGTAGAKESVHPWPTVRNPQRGGASCGVSSSGLLPPAG